MAYYGKIWNGYQIVVRTCLVRGRGSSVWIILGRGGGGARRLLRRGATGRGTRGARAVGALPRDGVGEFEGEPSGDGDLDGGVSRQFRLGGESSTFNFRRRLYLRGPFWNKFALINSTITN